MYTITNLKTIVIGVLVLLPCLPIAHAQPSLNVTMVGRLDSSAFAVAVSGDYAYLADWYGGLRVVDISDPANPFETGCYDTPGDAKGVAVSGDYAYVASGSGGLRVMDVSDPAHPFETGYYNTPGNSWDVAVSGAYAYVADYYGLWVVDVSDPSNPFETGYYDTPGWACGVAVSGNYAYVADGDLHVVDVSDPANPIQTGFLNTTSYAVAVSGDYAYVVMYLFFHVVDVSDPSNPFVTGSYNNLLNQGVDVAVSGAYAYLADFYHGLRVVDVNDPTNPIQTGYLNFGAATGVAVSGDYTYMANYFSLGIFDCSAAIGIDVEITLTPLNPPVTIPAAGGNFDYNVALSNTGAYPVTFDTWIMVILPDSSMFGPVLWPVNLTMQAGSSIDRDRTQNVPAGAPSGVYSYEGLVGIYPDNVWESDSFTFEKLDVGAGVPVNNWSNTGESLDLWFAESPDVIPSEFTFFDAYPNPFNPVTTISYQLPKAGVVKLSVYDISGRQVAELVNGWRDAGVHNVTFDASTLASGIYFYRIDAGEFMDVKKMVLMK